MSTSVELVRDGRVARVQFRGDGGIPLLSAATRRALRGIIDEMSRAEDGRVVVFEAVGRAFIAGVDINELHTADARAAAALSREGQQLMQSIADLPQVTICAIHAACAGGGCELALACDFRLAAAGARIGLPEVALGIIPGWGGTVRAVRQLGGAAARRMIVTGELLPAEEALRIGLVDSVTPDDGFPAAVDARIATVLSRGPQAVKTALRLIRGFECGVTAEQFAAEADAFADCFRTGEAAEGTLAFLEKRPPNWSRSPQE